MVTGRESIMTARCLGASQSLLYSDSAEASFRKKQRFLHNYSYKQQNLLTSTMKKSSLLFIFK